MAIAELEEIIRVTASRSASYIHAFNTNHLESINNCIAASVEKRKDYLRSYAARADIGLLNSQLKNRWIRDIFEHCGFESSPYFNRCLESADKSQQHVAEHKKKASVRQKKVALRKQKLERNHNPNKNKKYKYKTAEKCGCKTGCKNHRCSCFKAGRGCSPRCRCVSCTNNIQNNANECDVE